MEPLVIVILLGVLGLCMGSFAGATVWRLRARQLAEDKAEGEPVDTDEYKKLVPLTRATLTTDRSRCLHCGHELKWYDLLPLVSWLSTRGKCRYCHRPIGKLEPLIEIGTAVFFVTSYLLWPEIVTTIDLVQFGLWLAAGVILAILFAYDVKWFLLPNQVVFPLIGAGLAAAAITILTASDMLTALLNVVGAVVILSGLYLLLWYFSKGKWIGFGDVKLGLGLALLIGNWQLAFLALFLANLIGSLVVIPALLSGKMTRKSHVPFGPLLIVGSVIAALAGSYLLQWYFTIFI